MSAPGAGPSGPARPSWTAVAAAVATKDLRIELRSRVFVTQILPTAAAVMVLFAFALDKVGADLDRGGRDLQAHVAPGLVWMATIFSLLVLIQRAFAVEAADGALDALRVAGVAPSALFAGKAAALAAQLAVLVALLLGLSVVLFNNRVPSWTHAALLIVVAALTVAALAAVGTLYGGLAVGAEGRETLLPLLMLPVVVPVLIGATRAVEAAFAVGNASTGSGGIAMQEGWAWTGLVGSFAALACGGGALAFAGLVEE